MTFGQSVMAFMAFTLAATGLSDFLHGRAKHIQHSEVFPSGRLVWGTLERYGEYRGWWVAFRLPSYDWRYDWITMRDCWHRCVIGYSSYYGFFEHYEPCRGG